MSSQTELPKAKHVLDVSDRRLDNRFTLGVEGSAFGVVRYRRCYNDLVGLVNTYLSIVAFPVLSLRSTGTFDVGGADGGSFLLRSN